MVGAGFGFAVALRADAVARHPITAAFGTAAPVTVTPSESARVAWPGPADVSGDHCNACVTDEMSGRVVVFGRASDFDARLDGRPAGAVQRAHQSVRPVMT